MKELNSLEVMQVSGAGIIGNIAGGVGSFIGDNVYSLVGSMTGGIKIDLPLVGAININSLFPALGKDIGSTIGNVLGGTVENIIGGIPLIGGFLSGLLGNK